MSDSDLALVGIYCLVAFPLYLLFRFLHYYEARHDPDGFQNKLSPVAKLHIVFIFLALPVAFPIEAMHSYHNITLHQQGLLRFEDERDAAAAESQQKEQQISRRLEESHTEGYVEGYRDGLKHARGEE